MKYLYCAKILKQWIVINYSDNTIPTKKNLNNILKKYMVIKKNNLQKLKQQ